MTTLGERECKDYISALPVDCHLRFFSFLNYKDATSFAQANRKLYKASRHRDCKVLKTESMELIISQNGLCHMIEAKCPSGNYFLFNDTTTDSSSRFISEQSDPIRVQQQTNALERYLQICRDKSTEHAVLIAVGEAKMQSSRNDRARKHNLAHLMRREPQERQSLTKIRSPVPPKLLDRLTPLLRQFSLKSIKFQEIIFDVNFLTQCQEFFKGINAYSVNFVQSIFKYQDASEYANKFTEWLASMRPAHIYFGNTSIGQSRLIDEKFLNRVASVTRGDSVLSVANYRNYYSATPGGAREIMEARHGWLRDMMKAITRTPYKCKYEFDLEGFGFVDCIFDIGPEFDITSARSPGDKPKLTEKSSGGSAEYYLSPRHGLICYSIPRVA